MEEQAVIRVLVVDDHLVVRRGFAMFLKATADMELVGEAANGEEAIRACEELKPDVILMDMVMPIMSGVDAIQAIRRKYPTIRIIALTSFTDDNQLVQSALTAGATGFLFKNVSVSDLVNAIRMAHQNTPVLSPEATRMLISARSQRSIQDFNLSEREMEVLQLLVTGLNNPDIAEKLGVSRSTIKFHVSSILGKLGATSRTEAVSIAHQYKLVN